MKSIAKIFALLFTVALCISCTKADEGTLLQLNLPKGKTYKMTMATTRDAEVVTNRTDVTVEELKELTAQRFSIRSEETITYDYQVKDVLNNGNLVMEATTKRIQMAQSSGNASMHYDTENKGEAVGMYQGLIEAIDRKLNANLEMEFDRQGKLIRSSPDDQYDSPIHQCILLFSSEKVKVGSTWTFENKIKINSMNGKKKANVLVTAKLGSIENKVANLFFEGIYQAEKGETNFQLTGSLKGTAKVNTETGLTTEIIIDREVDLKEKNLKGAELPFKAKEQLIVKIE
jgi:hypothetical protein